MEKLTVFEVGMKIGERYAKFMESPDLEEVVEYSEIMRSVSGGDGDILIKEKTFRLESEKIIEPNVSDAIKEL